jgi:hypothetical protein
MFISGFRRGAVIAVAVVVFLALAVPALARTKWAYLRVVTHTGRTLAEFRQYTGATTVRATPKAKCFGRGNQSSHQRYRMDGANPLGIVKDALASGPALSPLRVSDAFVDDGFGLGVCDIGGFETVDFSYWYWALNGEAGTTGPDLTPVRNGDRVLWYFTSGDESGFPRELALRAPASSEPGEAFTVRVIRFAADGKSRPAAGARVTAGGEPVGRAGADGKLQVSLADTATLAATGTKDDVPSNRLRVCVSSKSGECPRHHGERIYGSPHADEVEDTRGWDRVKARGGGDVVDLRAGGHDRVSCGGGRDKVVVNGSDRNDRIASSCERVSRR